MRILFIFLFLITAELASAQTTVYDLVATCMREGDGAFSDWQNAEEGIAVTIDNKNNIKIYNKINSSYRLLKNTKNTTDSEGYEYSLYEAVDEEGLECTVKIMQDGEYFHIYAIYSDITLAFLVK